MSARVESMTARSNGQLGFKPRRAWRIRPPLAFRHTGVGTLVRIDSLNCFAVTILQKA